MTMTTHRTGANSGIEWRKFLFILAANVPFWILLSWAAVTVRRTYATQPGDVAQTLALVVGAVHVSFGLTAAALRFSARFLGDAEEADDLREQGSALLLGAGALISAGASLILLSLAGSGSLMPPAIVLAGALLLNALAWLLVVVRMRRLDELQRSLAREASYLALNWFSVIGGTWAIVAHLGFVTAPTPLAWLTMLSGFSFLGGIVALARRGGFDTPPRMSTG